MRALLIILLCTVLGLGARAQNLTIEASVDQYSVREGHSINLTVAVEGATGNLNPQLPDMPEFEIYETGSSFQQTIVNGNVSSKIVLSYMLIAKKAGRYKIGPIQIDSANSNVLDIEVLASGSPPPQAHPTPTPSPSDTAAGHASDFEPAPPGLDGSQSALITAEVDRSKPFVNQQITYIVRLYVSGRADLNDYVPPETTGFLVEKLLPQYREYSTEIDGRPFRVVEIRTALFAASSGERELNPAQVSLTVQDNLSSLFSDPWGYSIAARRNLHLETEKVSVDVQSLPTEGRPDGFSGAVGQYTMQATVDKTSVPAGQPVNLTVTVSGQGNVNLIAPPALPRLKSFRVYDTDSTSNVEKKNFEVTGTRTFKTVLVPLEEGKARIEGLKFSYFDPEAGEYKTVEAPPLTLDVTPGKVSRRDKPAGPADKLAGPKTYLGSKPLGFKPPAWLGGLQALPLLAVALAVLVGAFRRWREASSGERRQSMALRKARRELKKLRSVNAVEGGKVVLSAVHGFFSDRLGLTTFGLSRQELDRLLTERGLSPELRTQLREQLEAAEDARYAPAGQSLSGQEKPLSRLLFEIEEAL